MKKIVNFTFIAIAWLAVACHKDALVTTMAPVSFKSTLKASTSSVVLSATTDSTAVATLTWPAVVYPVTAHVTYTLIADVPTDTIGASPWANASSILVGKDVLTKTFKGSELNALALKLGVAANGTGNLVFRIQAYQDRATFSNAVTVSVSPWKIIVVSHGWSVLYVPGDYQGWNPAAAPTVAAEKPGIYEGFINIPAGGTNHLKFTNAPDWTHLIEGDAGNGQLVINSNPPDMVLPGAGFYELVVNTTALTWTAKLTTWGIIGDATPGGWNTDTQLTYNATTGLWTVTADMLSTGSFKFRANNAWNIDFGIDANGHLAYADNPAYPYNGSLNNLTVPTSGNYTITLDLRNPNNYNYTLKKN
jgi:starch-binding outer membrane protein SusE/F